MSRLDEWVDEKSDEWTDAKSMITPGIAGGFTMTVTNVLSGAFDVPEKFLMLVALCISFVIAFSIVWLKTMPISHRVVLGVLNAFVIFSAASGANYLGTKTNSVEAVASQKAFDLSTTSNLGQFSIIPSAFAASHESPSGTKTSGGEKTKSADEKKSKEPRQAGDAKVSKSDDQSNPKPTKPFFRSW